MSATAIRTAKVLSSETVFHMRVLLHSAERVVHALYDPQRDSVRIFSDQHCTCPAGLWGWQETEVGTAVRDEYARLQLGAAASRVPPAIREFRD